MTRPKIPPPTVPLGMAGLAWYRSIGKDDRCETFNRAEWHLLAETAHLVELAAETDNVRAYSEIRYRLRSLRLIESAAPTDRPSASAVASFNALRNKGRAADPRIA